MTSETKQKAMRAIGFLEGFGAWVWAHVGEDENLAPEFAGAYDDYDSGDVIIFVPLYFEHHYNWNFGRALGLCFVRKDAEKSPVNEFRSLLEEASSSIVEPYAVTAALLLGKVEEKLHELEGAGQSTQRGKDAVSRLAKRIEIIDKCAEDLRAVDRERTAQLGDSGSTGEERTGDDED